MNPLVSILFIFATNLSYTVFLGNFSIYYIKSTGTVFYLSTSILFISVFRLAKSDFAANLEVSTPGAFFKSVFVA